MSMRKNDVGLLSDSLSTTFQCSLQTSEYSVLTHLSKSSFDLWAQILLANKITNWLMEVVG